MGTKENCSSMIGLPSCCKWVLRYICFPKGTDTKVHACPGPKGKRTLDMYMHMYLLSKVKSQTYGNQ